MDIFDFGLEAHRRFRHALMYLLLIGSGSASVAAQVPDYAISNSSLAESTAAQGENSLDAQRIKAVIAALCEDKNPPIPVWFSEMPRMFKKQLRRLGQLESIRFLREQKGERVYELWFAGGRLIWGISDPLPLQPANMRVVLLEHL